MAENEVHLDKRQVLCPLCVMLGYGQSYRVNERKNKGALESRPVAGTDPFADDFFKVLHAERGMDVEVTIHGMIPEDTPQDMIITEDVGPGDIGDYKKILKGLGQPDAQALKFSQKSGLQARQQFVRMVNAGEVRAPRKNWDKTFGPEQMVTYEDPATGETTSFQIGGGTPLDELKEKYPELYGGRRTKTPRDKAREAPINDDILDQLENGSETTETRPQGIPVPTMAEPIETVDEDLEELAEEIEGDGAYAEEETHETSYSASATAEDELMSELMLTEAEASVKLDKDETVAIPPADAHEHQQVLTMQKPVNSTTVKTSAITYMDSEGVEQTAYKIQHPTTGKTVWVNEGDNTCPHCAVTLKVN